MSDYYVTQNSSNSVMVKEGEFFASQGGLAEDWGKHWTKVDATSIGAARRKGAELFGVTLSHIYQGEE